MKNKPLLLWGLGAGIIALVAFIVGYAFVWPADNDKGCGRMKDDKCSMMKDGGMMGEGGMMESMMGEGGMMSGMMKGMMGSPVDAASAPITVDAAADAARKYVADQGTADLKVTRIIEFTNGFYARVGEISTGTGAYELKIDRNSGAVSRTMGPGMMWNKKYKSGMSGMMGMMMGEGGMSGMMDMMEGMMGEGGMGCMNGDSEDDGDDDSMDMDGMEGMDHSGTSGDDMEGMDDGSMEGMDHSNMSTRNQSGGNTIFIASGMDGMEGMNQGGMSGGSSTSGMDGMGNMDGMDDMSGMDGMDGMSGMMGSDSVDNKATTADMTIKSADAASRAQKYVDVQLPGSKAGNPDMFYGYYTVDVTKDGRTIALLSVNGYTGQVWLQTWTGSWLSEKAL
ncbi:MAG: hypothetical protein Q7K29_08445 [Thermoleophilia bacterium]|nr:hypothetical protein [Thermoleophilia bacterium]